MTFEAIGISGAILLSDALRLMDASPLHRRWSVSDIGRLIIPPIHIGQHVFVRDAAGNPVGFGTWAFLTDEAQAGLQDGTRLIQPHDWSAGHIPWGIDVICIDGNPRRLIGAMRDRLRADGHGGKVIQFRRMKPQGIRYTRGRI